MSPYPTDTAPYQPLTDSIQSIIHIVYYRTQQGLYIQLSDSVFCLFQIQIQIEWN